VEARLQQQFLNECNQFQQPSELRYRSEVRFVLWISAVGTYLGKAGSDYQRYMIQFLRSS
jgi:hypothetical protein